MNKFAKITRSKTAARLAAIALVSGLAITGCSAGATTDATGATTTSSTASADATIAETASSTTTDSTIADTTDAADAFLTTLSDEQREQLLYDYDDETKSTSWSNFPVTFVERAGLNLADLTEEQQDAALAVLESLLSEEGYEQVTAIMDADQYLLDNSSSTEESLGQYYIAFFGEPNASGQWSLQFGGHHLGLNADLDGADGEISFTPTHLGTQPTVYTDADGNEIETMAGIYESAFAFYDSLNADQQAELYQGESVQDLECAPGGACDFPTGTGISGADLSDEQKQLLLDLIANWAGLADEETTADALAEIEASLDETYVNWSGATEYDMSTGSGIHFQISGPDVYVEFSNQQGSAGADVDGVTTAGWGHVHSIYRNPSNDYANSVEQQESAGMTGGPDGQAPDDGGAPGQG